MKDPVFSGKDVAEAVRTASRTLGVPEARLRYVVLEQGGLGGRGLSATEARIAVLIEKLGTPAPAVDGTDRPRLEGAEERRSRRREPIEGEQLAAGEPTAGIRDLVHGWARAAGAELRVEVLDGRDAVDVQIEGPGASALFDPQGDTLAALEHVIERAYGRDLAPRRIRVRCAGYREYRDAALRERALDLARLVMESGVARTTEPLNSYERRVIHVALEPVDGVETYSVGEGSGRRVTVAPRELALAGDVTTDVTTEDAVVEQPQEPPPIEAALETPDEEAVPAAGASEGTAAGAAVDWRQFDRPATGGGDAGLM
jgi:predicted RNA-binding protein Jag